MSGHTIDTWLRDRARTTRARVAIDFDGREVDVRGARARAPTSSRAVLRHGELVSTLTGNSAEHVALLFACAKAGAILHPISWRLAPAEIAYQLDDAASAVLLVEEEHRGARRGGARARERARRANGRPVSHGGSTRGACAGRRPAAPDLHLGHDRQAEGRAAHARELLLDEPLVRPRDRGRAATTSCSQSCRSSTAAAGTCSRFSPGGKAQRSCSSASFDPRARCELIEEKRVTTMMGVPANYLFMAQEPGFDGADLSSLRLAVVGGAPMPVPLLEHVARARRRDRAGLRPDRGGAERAVPAARGRDAEDRLGRQAVSVRRGATSAPEGELLVRGPNVFPGYWRDPEATAAAFRDGWLHTGDVAERDDEGYFRISGPAQGHGRLGRRERLPGRGRGRAARASEVADAAVVGVPDERWGEVVLAFVVLDPPVSEDELRAFCRDRLARFKVPKSVARRRRAPAQLDGQDREVGAALRMTT